MSAVASRVVVARHRKFILRELPDIEAGEAVTTANPDPVKRELRIASAVYRLLRRVLQALSLATVVGNPLYNLPRIAAGMLASSDLRPNLKKTLRELKFRSDLVVVCVCVAVVLRWCV